jgi:hypothetical protein
LEKPKGQSRMENPETMATLDIHDTEWSQTKQKHKSENQSPEHDMSLHISKLNFLLEN